MVHFPLITCHLPVQLFLLKALISWIKLVIWKLKNWHCLWMFHSAGLYVSYQEVQHQNPGHIPFHGRILMGLPFSTWQDTWLSGTPLASVPEIPAAPTKALTPRASAEPCSEVVKHPTVSNCAVLAKQDEKLTRPDPIILSCKCTASLMQKSDPDSMTCVAF